MPSPRTIEIDITGRRYGRLIAVRKFGKDRGKRKLWLFKCDCGREKVISKHNVTRGATSSCRCLQKEGVSARRKSHGMSKTIAYNHWFKMLQRCRNPKHPAYSRYGGRGITVCTRWQKFENFYKDMGPRPDGRSLDRIDNDGGYSPQNCRWATRTEQANNASHNVLIEHDGKIQTIAQWARETGINYHTIRERHLAGTDPFRQRSHRQSYPKRKCRRRRRWGDNKKLVRLSASPNGSGSSQSTGGQ